MEWDTDIPALDVLLDEASRARSVALACLPNLGEKSKSSPMPLPTLEASA
jgi:hypothetical protein